LLRTRRFLPLFLTQFLGAFNDNLYKTALAVVVVFGLAEANADLLTNLAAGLFIAPFFLFSAAAGQLSDKFDKARIIRLAKTAEIFIMALAMLGWAMSSTAVLFRGFISDGGAVSVLWSLEIRDRAAASGRSGAGGRQRTARNEHLRRHSHRHGRRRCIGGI
jgi:MFS family permease